VADKHRFVAWIRRLSEIALIGFLAVLVLPDVALTASGRNPFPVLLCDGVGLAAVILRRRHRVNGMAVLLATSIAATIAISVTRGGAPGSVETAALLVLTIGVLRWVRPVYLGVTLAVLAMVTLEATTARLHGPQGLAFGFLLFVAWSAAGSVGGYLRFQQERRVTALDAVRRSERLELARELHDMVAHHITGIVVQAQAARTVGEGRPEAVLPALDAIATAGGDALTAMRRLVGVLRADDEASRSPGTSLADLWTLVQNFSASGPKVVFDIGPGVSEAHVPPEVLTTLHRVLQESLTNVRRHAPGADWVEADLRLHSGGVRLRVRNFGSATDPRLSRLGGGFGLVGMAERVEALGGRLTAGPTPEGAWEVCAVFPPMA
jgi:signal transduction histidine kinase